MRLGRRDSDDVPVTEEVTGTRRFMETAVVVVGALVLAVLIQQFLIKPYKIPSPSMAPTLVIGQRVLVNRVGTRVSDPAIGQITVFHPPAGADVRDASAQCGRVRPATQLCAVATSATSKQAFIKRVVGLPGDRIALVGGHVVRNGKPLPEPYAQSCAGPECNLSEITVPAGSYYLLGDNRDDSDDSRYWGPVRGDDVIGRAIATYWPPNRIGGVDLQ